MSKFHSLVVGGETQLQVADNLNDVIQRFKA